MKHAYLKHETSETSVSLVGSSLGFVLQYMFVACVFCNEVQLIVGCLSWLCHFSWSQNGVCLCLCGVCKKERETER